MPANYSRVTTAPVKTTDTTYTYGFGCNIITSKSTVTYPVYQVESNSRTFTGTKVPNWKVFQRENGYLPTTSSTDLIIEQKANDVTTILRNGCGHPITIQEGGVLCGLPPDEGFPNVYMDVAFNKLRSRVANSDFNLAVTIAEANKTVNFVFERAKTFSKALRQFRRGRFKDSMNTLELTSLTGSAKNWLSYKFGWTPLLMDAKNSAEAFARYNYNHSRAMRYSARFGIELKVPMNLTNNSSYNAQQRTVVSRQHDCLCWVIVKNNNPQLRALAESGLSNPGTVLWEVTPFSWVADYFLNIGDYLQASSAFDGLTILDSGRWWRTIDSGIMYQGVASGNRTNERSSTYRRLRYARTPGMWQTSLLRHLHYQASNISLKTSQIANVAALIRVLTSDDKSLRGYRS